jgi:hypothetical protein
MHRYSLYLQHYARPQLEKAAITFTRYLVSNTTDGEVTDMFQESLEQSLLEWHLKFRENMKNCRTSARMNGNTLTEKSSSLGFVKDEVECTWRHPCAPLRRAGTGTNSVANGVDSRVMQWSLEKTYSLNSFFLFRSQREMN